MSDPRSEKIKLDFFCVLGDNIIIEDNEIKLDR